jgi:hypothetical protein
MSRKAIKDRNFRTLDYIETMSDGRQNALNANCRTLATTILAVTSRQVRILNPCTR